MENNLEFYENAIKTAQLKGSLTDLALAYEDFALFWLARNNKKIAQIYINDAFELHLKSENKIKTDELLNKYSYLLNNYLEVQTLSCLGNKFNKEVSPCKNIFDAVSGMLIIIDRDFNIIHSNYKQHDEIISSDNELCKTCYGRFKLLDKPCEDCSAKPVFETGEPVIREMINPADNRTKEVRAFPIKNHSGEVIYVIEYVNDIEEYKKAEKELKESKLQLEVAINGGNVGLWDWDFNTNRLFTSSVMKKHLGYNDDEKISDYVDDWLNRIHPDDVDATLKKVNEAIESDDLKYNAEFRLRHKDGSYRWILSSATVIKDEKNAPVRMLGAHIDITDIKQTEEQIKISLGKYKALFDSFPVGVCITDKDGNILESNQESQRLLCMSVKDHLSRKIDGHEWKIIRPDGSKMPFDEFASVRSLKTNKLVENVEMGLVMENQEIKWINVHAAPIHLEGYGVAITYHDITERKNAEQALKQSYGLFQNLFEHLPSVAVQGYSMDGTVKYWNDASEKLYGYTREEAIGQNLLSLIIPPEMQDEVKNAVKYMSETEKAIPASELSLMKKDKSLVPVFSSHAVIKLPGCEPEFFCIDIDLSELKKSEEKLIHQKIMLARTESIAKIGSWEWEVESDKVKWSDELFHIFKMKPAEKAPSFAEHARLYIPEDVEKLKKAVELAVNNGVSYELELTAICSDGEKKTLLAQGHAEMGERGRAVKLFGFAHDITERKQAEQALKESEEKYRLLFENMLNGFAMHEIITDENNNPIDYIVTEINPAYEKLTGISKEMVINKNIKSALPNIEDSIIKKFGAVALTGRPAIFEHYSKPLDKYYHIFSFSNRIRQFTTIFNDITEIKKSQKKLLESKNQLQTIFDASPAIMIVFNEKCEIVKINKTGLLFAGQNHENILFKPCGDVFSCIYSFNSDKGCGYSPDCKNCVMRNTVYDTFANNCDHYKIETILKTRNHDAINEYNILFSTSLHEFENEKAVLITIDNITELKLTQKALQESEELLKTIINAIPDAICLKDSDGRWLVSNNANIEAFGLQYIDWQSKKDSEIAEINKNYSESLVYCIKTDEITWQNRKQSRFEEKVIIEDGTHRYYDIIKIPIFNIKNEKKYLVVVARDITDRKNAEISLKQSEEKYRSLFEGSRDGIVISDIKGNIIDCNQSFSDMLGYTIEELINTSILDITPPELHDWEINLLKENLFTTGYLPSTEKQYIKKDGSIIDAEFTLYLYEADKTNLKVWGIVRDITEAKKTLEMLKHSQKMEAVGQLAGGIAHDFNNMLAGIIGYTEISLNMIESGGSLEKNLMQILKASDRAKNLVNQILSFSRKEAHKKVNIYLRPILKEVVELIKVSIPSSIIIKTDINKDKRAVYADSVKIHEVLMNLITNAVHAMNEKGELTISLREECLFEGVFGQMGVIEPGEYSVIEVSDTGCGMDSETIKKIFEPFFTTKPTGKGTGMGLAVVYGVVQSHSGNIQIISKPGEGTTFRIFLPKSESTPVETENEDQPDIMGNENVLFVDDELMIVEMAKELLLSMGYNVTATNNCEEALHLIVNNPEKFDLLITDQTMPRLTGVELAKEALKIKPDLPIILCTGYSSVIDADNASEMGIKKFLMKPLTRNELGKAIREVCEKNEQ